MPGKNCPEPKFQIVLLDGLLPMNNHFTSRTRKSYLLAFVLAKIVYPSSWVYQKTLLAIFGKKAFVPITSVSLKMKLESCK